MNSRLTRFLRGAFIAFGLITCINATFGQKIIYIDFPLRDSFSRPIGKLTTFNKNAWGTAFIAGSDNDVITCAHNMIDDSMFFYNLGLNATFKIALQYKNEYADIAVLSRIPSDSMLGYNIGSFDSLRIGDTIYYAGVADSIVQHNLGIIRAKGEISNGAPVEWIREFIDFPGRGQTGYSGGPVLNLKGEVVAIVAQIFFERGLNSIDSAEFIRAFSIKPVIDYLQRN
jgi:S1-C subfamily serine protease